MLIVKSMHAFLLIGPDKEELKTGSDELAKKLHAKIMDFPLIKIDDVRSLNNLIRLSFEVPTLIVCQNIHEAGEAALNAFLKNLEEPQENIYFALTAPTTRKVLSTIVSRCQVIRINKLQLTVNNEDAEEFVKLSVGEKLAYIDKIKDREKAIELTESLVNSYHNAIHSGQLQGAGSLDTIARNAETAGTTLNRLKANGNINLQLTNLIISLV